MQTPPPLPTRSRFAWPLRLLIVLVALPIIALVLFYPVENWRGKRAWEKCQRELKAKGEVLDWDAHIPSPVPDDQNVFKAPHMADWFVGRGTNELARQLNSENLVKFCQRFHTNIVVEISIVERDAIVDRATTDLVLNYDPPVLSLESTQAAAEKPDPRFAKIPLIQFQDVPLPVAIENLARQAELNFTVDRTLDIARADIPQPVVTFRWQNISATQALIALLDIYDLEWREDSKTGVALVCRKGTGGRLLAYVGGDLQERIQELVRKSILRPEGEYSKERCLSGSQGLELTLNSPPQTKPARVVLRTSKTLNARDVVEFFPTNVVLSGVETTGLRVEGDNNRFQVLLSPPPFSPKEYLAWSDQFIPEFDTMREALKRPNARMEGDYQHPANVPIPNYVTFRRVVETLTQRAQCFLLLNQPDKAIHELTLVHKLSRSLVCRPTSIVAAMTQVAISDSYVKVISDGLRRQTWREPHLTEIQDQLKQVDLLPSLMEGFRLERASFPKTMRLEVAARLKKSHELRLYPTGWLYQNYVSYLAMYEKQVSCLDVTNRIVFPQRAAQFTEYMTQHKVFWPYEMFAYIAMPNFIKTFETAAFQQTRREEAQVACVLERYRSATGKYPLTLEALCPQFLEGVPRDIVGGQSLKYRRDGDDRFTLYSIGWNETDDRGTAQLRKDGSVDTSSGDWVWQSFEDRKDRLFTAN